MATLKPKYYKLGKKASSFWDPASKTKILRGQVIKVEGDKTRSKRLAAAVSTQHILLAEEEEYDKYLAKMQALKEGKVPESEEESEDDDITSEDSPELISFKRLKVQEMKDQIFATYELDDKEVEEINSLTKPQLIEKFKELEGLDTDEDQD